MDHKPVVLIVDDQDDFPEIMAVKLSTANIDTVHIKKPKTAVEEAAKLKPDLILVDVNMPEEPGTELLLDFKLNDVTKDIPIAFLTNSKDPWPGMSGSDADVAKEIGASDFLQKTEDLSLLLGKIQVMLGLVAPPTVEAAPAPAPAPSKQL